MQQYTKLNNRCLYFDGDSTVTNETLNNLIASGKLNTGLFVERLTSDIKQYNKLVGLEKQIKVKQSVGQLDFTWNIPHEYQTLNVVEYVMDRLDELDPQNRKTCVDRVVVELQLFHKLGLMDVLRAIIYLINSLEANKVVWGVGRGSSVSSYVLYLIGVHDVDSIQYGLDIDDFLRTE